MSLFAPYFRFGIVGVAFAMLLLAGAAWRRRDLAPGARPFTFLMLSAFCYAAGYAGELGQVDRAGALAWLHVEYLGIPWASGLWLWVSLEHAGRRLRTRNLLLLFVIPTIVFLGHHTNAWHGLYYRSLEMVPRGPFHLAHFQRGIIYWLHTAYFYSAFVIAFWICVSGLRAASEVYRRQALAMFGGAVIPFIAFSIHIAGRSPWGLDPIPFALAISGFLFFAGIFWFALFDLVPVARTHVFEGMRDAVLVMDPEGRLIDFNPAARELLPGLAQAPLGQPISQSLCDLPDLANALNNSGIHEVAWPGPKMTRHFEVRVFPLRVRGRKLGHAAILADISERVRLLEEVQRLADSDALTGLANRRRFAEAMALEILRSARYGTPLSVLLMDVDHFKRTNDRYGHAAGDAVLQAIAQRTQTCLRATDVLARHGGEEFAVLLPSADREEALIVAERIRLILAQAPVNVGSTAIPVTVSIGIAVHPGGPGGNSDHLLSDADRAMYQAKAAGRNQVSSRQTAE